MRRISKSTTPLVLGLFIGISAFAAVGAEKGGAKLSPGPAITPNIPAMVPPVAPPPVTKTSPQPMPEPAERPAKPTISNAPVINKPDAPAAAIAKPQLEQQRLQQIQRMQDADKINAIRQMEQIKKGAAVMPETLPGGPGHRDARPGDMAPEIARDKGLDVDQTVRDAMIGRGGPFNRDPSTYIGRSGSSGPNLNRGPGSGADAVGAPAPDGRAQSGPGDDKALPTIVHGSHSQGEKQQQDGTTTEWINYETSDGESVHGERNEGRGEFTATTTRQDKQGNTVITTITGRTGPDSDTPETWNRRTVDENGRTIKYSFGTGAPPHGQGAPNDNDVGKGSNCVGPSNWGCKGGKNDPMDMVTQPAHGDSVANIRGTSARPNAGPAAVTNPGGEGGTNTRGGGGGKPYDPRDPEKIIPGGPVAGPGNTDADIDAALGAYGLKPPPQQ